MDAARSPGRAASLTLPAALLAAVAGPLAAIGAQEVDGPQCDLDAHLARFVGFLSGMRSGSAELEVPLAELGRHLCEVHARCDALDVARFYSGLPVEERRQGLADEKEFHALRMELVEAGHEGLGEDEDWSELREQLVGELGSFVERTRAAADPQPAARALALLARLEIDRAENESGMPRSQLARVLDSVAEHAHESIDLFARAGIVTPQLEPLWVLGRLERARHHSRAARQAFESCGELAGRAGNDEFRAQALFGLVALARDAGDLAEVDRCLGEIATLTGPDESWPLAREHASRLLQVDRAEPAIAFLLRHPPAAASHESEWHALLGTALLRTGDVLSARREIAELESSGELSLLAQAALDLAEGRPEEVIEALAEPGLLADWSFEAQAQACSFLGEAWLRGGRHELAIDWLRAALERAEAWQSLQGEPTGGSVIGEWIGLHTVVLLAVAEGRAGRALTAARILEDYQSRRLRLRGLRETLAPEDMASGSPGSPGSPGSMGSPGSIDADGSIDDDDLCAWAANYDRGLVTWGVGADGAVVAHVDAEGGAWAAPVPGGRRDFESAVRRLREAVVLGDDARARELGREISARLLPGELVARLLRDGDGGTLLFLLHGPLEALPVTLLELDGTGVDERFTPVVLPGLPAARPGRRVPPGEYGEWTLLGNPWSTSDELRLPGAARELGAIARVRPRARLLSGAAFVPGALTDALERGGPLHIATHLVRGGCPSERLAAVGLELSGSEVVCAEEIFDRAPRSPLVVLTTCDTAGGRFIDAEGFYGISRAFLEPGTRNLLVTLWPVADAAAERFAVHFHEGLISGAMPSAAARAARAKLRAEGRPAADWAAFRFMGRD